MKIHFIGIGGIGVSALARYYLAKGEQVSGSDLARSEIIDSLKKLGVKIFIMRHSGENLPDDVDLVVYSPAVNQDNPELKKARKLKFTRRLPSFALQIKSYPKALGELTKKYFTIAVSGTHGKSTTSAMIALILIKAGLNPTVILGTKLKEFGNSNFHLGGTPRSTFHSPFSKILIIEADEHFASFLNYRPEIIVLTNIEADHLDYYKNLKNYLNSFKKFVSLLPENGALIANKDDKNIQELKNLLCDSSGKMPRVNRIRKTVKVKNYSLEQKEARELKKILKVPGRHNVYNALAALTLARALKIPDKISFKALSEYKGAWRRFDVKKGIIDNKKFTIISDYAHHPTEIKATLEAAREKYHRKKIWCVFQPHQYQRTFYLFDDFVKVLSRAPVDKLIITDIYDVAGREEKKIKKKVSSEKLIEKINNSSAIYLSKEKIKGFLKKNLKGGEIVIIMGAGDIYDLVAAFPQKKLDIGKKKGENK